MSYGDRDFDRELQQDAARDRMELLTDLVRRAVPFVDIYEAMSEDGGSEDPKGWIPASKDWLADAAKALEPGTGDRMRRADRR